jgi:hypothetical protein
MVKSLVGSFKKTQGTPVKVPYPPWDIVWRRSGTWAFPPFFSPPRRTSLQMSALVEDKWEEKKRRKEQNKKVHHGPPPGPWLRKSPLFRFSSSK